MTYPKEFSKQEYWSGQPFPSSRNPPNPGIEPRCPALEADSLLSESLSSVQSFHCVRLCDSTDCSTPGFPVIIDSQRLLKLMSIGSVMPSVFPSIKVFSNESVLHIRWPEYWGFSFSISPSNEQSGLISFRIDWYDLLAVQGTLESLLQYYSTKASILQHSAFFMVQLSHPYMTTGKTIALTRQTFVSKVMSLLFNMLSRLVITFLPRSKHLLISWLQSPTTVILEATKIKSDTVFTVSSSICH